MVLLCQNGHCDDLALSFMVILEFYLGYGISSSDGSVVGIVL
jgi:hypothetical protein